MTAGQTNPALLLLAKSRRGDERAASLLAEYAARAMHAVLDDVKEGLGGRRSIDPRAMAQAAYSRLVKPEPGEVPWTIRAHFLALFAGGLRRSLVARVREASAGTTPALRVTLPEIDPADEPVSAPLLDLHEAIEALGRQEARHARLADLRIFAGLANREVAEVHTAPLSAVELDWRLTGAWLAGRLMSTGGDGLGPPGPAGGADLS